MNLGASFSLVHALHELGIEGRPEEPVLAVPSPDIYRSEIDKLFRSEVRAFEEPHLNALVAAAKGIASRLANTGETHFQIPFNDLLQEANDPAIKEEEFRRFVQDHRGDYYRSLYWLHSLSAHDPQLRKHVEAFKSNYEEIFNVPPLNLEKVLEIIAQIAASEKGAFEFNFRLNHEVYITREPDFHMHISFKPRGSNSVEVIIGQGNEAQYNPETHFFTKNPSQIVQIIDALLTKAVTAKIKPYKLATRWEKLEQEYRDRKQAGETFTLLEFTERAKINQYRQKYRAEDEKRSNINLVARLNALRRIFVKVTEAPPKEKSPIERLWEQDLDLGQDLFTLAVDL